MEERKHSEFGIASFLINIVSGIFSFLVIVISLGIERFGESAGELMISLFLFVLLGAALVALGLGISGLLQKERRKIFAILGTVFSVALLLLALLIVIVGGGNGVKPEGKVPNKALHRTAIPLGSIAAGELWRYVNVSRR